MVQPEYEEFEERLLSQELVVMVLLRNHETPFHIRQLRVVFVVHIGFLEKRPL